MALLEDLKAINDSFNQAIDRGDVNAAAAHFTKSGICTAPDTPIVRGHAALAGFFRTWVDAGITNIRDGDHIAESEGDIAHMVCTYANDYQSDDGSVTSEQGKVLQIFKLDENGAWKIHRIGFSTDLAQ